MLVSVWSLVVVPAQSKQPEFDLGSIQTVAVFGFGGENEIEATETKSGLGVLDAVNSVRQTVDTVEGLKDGSLKQGAQDQASGAYDLVGTRLAEGFGWTVLPREELSATPAYAALNAELSGTGQLAAMAQAWGAGMAPRGVVHYLSAQRVKQPERDALLDALGVDALAIVQLVVSGSDTGFSVGGIGTSVVKPRALVRLQVYQKGEKKAVWIGYALGDKTEEAIRQEFGFAPTAQDAVVLAAIDNGAQRLTEKFATP